MMGREDGLWLLAPLIVMAMLGLAEITQASREPGSHGFSTTPAAQAPPERCNYRQRPTRSLEDTRSRLRCIESQED